MRMRTSLSWVAFFLALSLLVSSEGAVVVDFTYTQTDATTGSGTITGNIDTSLYGGSGMVTLTGAMPAATLTQNDTNTGFTVPANAVGFITTADGGSPGIDNGVHIGFSGAVTISGMDGTDLWEVDVPLVLTSGDQYSYSFSVFDNPAENDVTGNPRFAGWPGDNTGGHRHTNGQPTFGAGQDNYTASASGGLGGNADGDNAGFAAGIRDGSFNGPVFVDDITYGGQSRSDDSTLRVNGNPASLPPQTMGYAPPPGDWYYMYDGTEAASATNAALDGTWDHDNGSDEWDGTTIGTGRPGGAQALRENDDIFLRIQDTGDPRDYGMGDPGSNRKVGFTKDIRPLVPDGFLILDDGVTMTFRAKLATDAPLDDAHPDGGGGTSPWPAGGDGYVIHDRGKGTFGFHQEDGDDQTISFALALDSDHGSLSQNGLVMNSLNGTSRSDNVNTGDGTNNQLVVADPTQFHEFWVTIQKDNSGGGTHRVDVYMDGSTTPDTFHVTSGTGEDEGRDYLALYQGSTGQSGASDVDFYGFRPGVFAPNSDSIITRAVRGGSSTNEPPLVWPGALVEDANTYVDRTHEYNNLPAEIVGADYVQTTNDDKGSGDYTLDITIDEPADLYFFLDNRIRGDGIPPGLNWMFDGSTVTFKNTLLNVGYDESGDGDIDQTGQVFIAPNLAPGTYRMFEHNAGNNMYGVAATQPAFDQTAIESVTRSGGDSDAPEEPQVVFGPTGGLQDGVPMFVDRNHEWTQVPAELLGSEYVMLANDDKDEPNFVLDVELARHTDLYLLIDDRVGDDDNSDGPDLGGGTMDWVLNMGFEDTGLNVGADEDGNGDINQWASVFLLEYVRPGTIQLLAQDDGGSRNMYGVAAQVWVPEPSTLVLLALGLIGLMGYRWRKRRTG